MSTDPTAGQPQPGAPAEAPDELAKLRAELAELRSQVARPQAPRGDTLGVPEPPQGLPDYAHEWPREGGFELADGKPAPQPWDLRAHGLRVGVDDDGMTTVISPHTGEVRELKPGAPNTISPIVPVHGRPLLGPLSADPSVFELGRLLAELGISTSVSEGRNPNGVVDESVLEGVNRFREAFGVREDPSGWPVDGERQASLHVGAWTWEALLRAARQVRQETEHDGRVIAHARG